MALYKFVVADNSVVLNTSNNAFIPTADGQGGWQGDAYRTWLAAGNTPDAYVAPAAVTPVAQQIPILADHPAPPSSGSIIYTLAAPDGQTYVQSSAGTITGIGEK